jgi:uncharacterized protein YjiS (DUF1127 family)
MDVTNRYRRWRRYRSMVRELKGYSQHELAELDISQRDIERVAYAANYGRA